MSACPECVTNERVKGKGRHTTAKVDGIVHAIPEIWLAGAMWTGATAEEVVRYWHDQCQMAAL